MITDQSQWNDPLVASDGTRTVEVVEIRGPALEGDYLVTFAEDLIGLDGYLRNWALFKSDGTARYSWNRNITISPAAEAAGDICQLMPDGGGDASDEITALREEVARLREREKVERTPHVFLDCDGVLADFDKAGEQLWGMPPREYEAKVGSKQFWHELEHQTDFYGTLPLMPDAMDLFDGVKHLHPTILTGCPRGNWAQGQKVAWAARHFPGVPIITCRSADKRDFAKPGDVLIDDWPQHRHRWIEMGGVFISHYDAASSLSTLWSHYPALESTDQ